MGLLVLFLSILYVAKCTSKVIQLEFDQDYGCDKKTGWTLCIDGVYYVSHIEPSLFVCLKKGIASFSKSEYKLDVIKKIIDEILFK